MAKRGADKFSITELTASDYGQAITGGGVAIVNVHAKWTGPCLAVVPVLTAARLELGEDKSMIRFYHACADDIPELEPYRGKCRPCMMIHAGGDLVDVIRGVNGPLIRTRVLHHVKYEKRVLDDLEERIVFIDKAVGSRPSSGESVDISNEAAMECIWMETTAALIKPAAVAAGILDTIRQRVIDDGFEIVAEATIQLDEDKVRALYSEHESKDFFPELSQSMTNKDVVAWALRRDKAIARWRDLLGHTYPETAKQQNPDSLRALYGKSNTENCAHGSYSELLARKELKLLFGEEKGEEYAVYEKIEVARTSSAKVKSAAAAAEAGASELQQDAAGADAACASSQPAVSQYTVALIKPGAAEHAAEIVARIEGEGFTVLLQEEQTWDEAKAGEFYAEHKDKGFFGELVEFMTSAKLVAMLLTKDDAIVQWRALQGPTKREEALQVPDCLRAKYGVDQTNNGFHGSDGSESANREALIVFGEAALAKALTPNPTAAETEATTTSTDEAAAVAADEEGGAAAASATEEATEANGDDAPVLTPPAEGTNVGQ